eukprot:s234_g1.t1
MQLIGEVNALRVKINGIYQRFDIPDDVYRATGFNVINAEMGYYHDVKMRYEAFQVFNDTLSKRTETQGGTNVTSLHRFEDWGVPLTLADGRDPPSIVVDEKGELTLPFWSKDVYLPNPAQAKTSGDGEGSHSSTKVDPTPEPKASIEDLNGRAVGYERMGIEKTVFERCTELPTIFKEEDDKTASTRKPVEGRDRYFYQMTYDGGNVAYKDFLTALLTEEEYVGLFSNKSKAETSAESMGDIVECWMGILTLGTYFPQLFEQWGTKLRNVDMALKVHSGHIKLPVEMPLLTTQKMADNTTLMVTSQLLMWYESSTFSRDIMTFGDNSKREKFVE